MSLEKVKNEIYALVGGRNTKASVYDNGQSELREIVNLNFTVQGALTQRPGTALYTGATVSGRITGAVEYQKLDGTSFLIATANTTAYTVTTSSFTPFKTGLSNDSIFSFVTFVDRLFAANGTDYFKFDGSNTTNVGLPAGMSFSAAAQVGGSMTAGVTGVFVASYGYFNDRFYFGPAANGITITLNGVTFNSIAYSGMTMPSGYGISGILLYRTSPGGLVLTGTTTIAGASLPAGATVIDTGYLLGSRIETDATQFTLIPRYLELFNNQLFMAGFSQALSTAYWSQIGEPEAVEPEFFVEFRTNDGDRITGMKSYLSNLAVFKQRSFHQLGGTNPNNFFTVQLSDQYGALSNRAIITWEDRLWFLDAKGIVEWNGANLKIVSNKVEDVFATMNVTAAQDNATAIHYKQFNELWFAIPTDGSTINNTIIVYDYVSDAWTVYKGIQASVLFSAKQTLTQKQPFFGGYSGSISYVAPSLPNDQGQAITCMIKTAFEKARGDTVENMYRRFYLNINPLVGVTLPIEIKLRTNYDTTVRATFPMYRAPFQTRVDFGQSARSIQAEVTQVSASFPITIYGYAWESRFQRPV